MRPLKSAAMNKFVSKQSRIIVQSNQSAKPGDFVIYQGIVYIMLSKKQVSERMFEYTGVRETTTSWTFSGADVTPVNRPAMIRADDWHTVDVPGGTTGEPQFQNGWKNFSGYYQGMRFLKDDFGFVSYEGLITAGIANTVFTFPVGYRPALEVFNPCVHWNGTTRNAASANIAAYGDLVVTQSLGTTWVTLSGRFYAGF